jgi:hypothetical protein
MIKQDYERQELDFMQGWVLDGAPMGPHAGWRVGFGLACFDPNPRRVGSWVETFDPSAGYAEV